MSINYAKNTNLTDKQFLQMIWGIVYLYTEEKPCSKLLLRLNRMIEAIPEPPEYYVETIKVEYWTPRHVDSYRIKGINYLARMFNINPYEVFYPESLPPS